jgi:hypothetical protein
MLLGEPAVKSSLPVVQHTVLLLAEVWVAAAVAGCQLTHGGAPTLADVVKADSATLGSMHMTQVQPACNKLTCMFQKNQAAVWTLMTANARGLFSETC